MHKAVIVMTFTVAAFSCGPEVDDADDPPGKLEYEDPFLRYYRLDRRVDMVAIDPMLSRSGCGFLTDRAYGDLMSTYGALDPNVDYGAYPDCPHTGPPRDNRVYLDGHEYSPFECAWYCCHPDLIRAAIVYWAAATSLDGPDPNINGEIYVALEPEIPCPN